MRRSHAKAAVALLAGLAIAGLGAGTAQAEDYKIGYITDLSGPLAGSYTPTWEGFELYMKTVNNNGGINGNKVDVVLDDDGLKVARAVAHAKKQAQSDKVLGIFGLSLSSTQGPVYAEMRKAGVPVVSTFSGILDALPPAKPYSYSTGVVFEVAGEVIGGMLPRIKEGGTVVGVTIDTVGGRAAIAHNKAVAEELGYSWGEVIFPVRTPDFTPHAQAVIEQNPDIVVGHYGSGHNLGMISALRKAGYTGPYVIAVYGVTEETIKLAAEKSGTGENLYTVNRYASATQTDIPAVMEVKKAAEKYGTSKPFSTMHVTGWALGKFAEAALAKCGNPCSRDKLNAAIETLEVDTGGLTGGPIKMSENDHYGTSYWLLSKWDPDANKLVPVGDWVANDGLKYKAE